MMDDLEQPIKTIQNWQEWYRKHKVVAEINEPLASKDSREKMHDTSNAVANINDMPSPLKEYDARTNAFNDFSDVLASYMGVLGGKELYKIFFKAAQEYADIIEAEYKQANDLVNSLRYRTKG